MRRCLRTDKNQHTAEAPVVSAVDGIAEQHLPTQRVRSVPLEIDLLGGEAVPESACTNPFSMPRLVIR
jgi:hypothetical protein